MANNNTIELLQINPSKCVSHNKSPASRKKFIEKEYTEFQLPPKRLGYFSIDKDRNYIPDKSNLKYLSIPKTVYENHNLNINLNYGYENVRKKDENVGEREKLDHLLTFIKSNVLPNIKQNRTVDSCRPNSTESSDYSHLAYLNINFVCFRGLLRLLMCTPYDYNNLQWIILATKFKGTVYLYKILSDGEKGDIEKRSDDLKRILSYGFKFEQYLLSDAPTEKPNIHRPVDENEEFCCMFRKIFYNYSVLYGAEMDGIEITPNSPTSWTNEDNWEFNELKVNLYNHDYRKFCRNKTRPWWCQCVLADIKQVIVGTRSYSGIVQKIHKITTNELRDDGNSYWKPEACITFLNRFLGEVYDKMKDIDCPYTVFKFNYDSNSHYNITFERMYGKNNYSFLPDWYVNAFNESNK